jgi:hypothetical protein
MSAVGRPHAAPLLGLLLLAPLAAPPPAAGQAAPAAGAVLGKSASRPGTLLARRAGSRQWTALKPGDAVRAGDDLVALVGTRARVDLRRGALRLELVGLLPEETTSAARASRVRLRAPGGADLNFTLRHGRVLLRNPSAKQVVRVHFLKEMWQLTLDEPKTEALLERHGVWPVGARLPRTPGEDRQPYAHALVLLLTGEAHLATGSEQYAFGPRMLYRWTSEGGGFGPLVLKELPDFVKEKAPAKGGGGMKAGAEHLRKLLAELPVARALSKALASGDAGTRRAAVYAADALDDVGLLLVALGDARRADVRDAAVVALRDWLGQAAGHPAALYKALTARRYTPAKAETVLHLLHSFSPEDRERPETYDTLIEYLRHGDLRVRQLAYWQLVHMVPQGKRLRPAYNAGGTPQELARGQAAWRRLIPQGQLPPPPEKKGE